MIVGDDPDNIKAEVDSVDDAEAQTQQSKEADESPPLLMGGSSSTVSSGDTDDLFDDESLTKEDKVVSTLCCGLAMTWLGCIMLALLLVMMLVLDDVEQSYHGPDVAETLIATRRSNNNTDQRLEMASRLELCNATMEDLADPAVSTPQSQAMDWLLQDGNHHMGLTQLQQRFTLLTLMFASPDLMARAANFAHDYHECGWFHHQKHDDRILSCDGAHKLSAITIKGSQSNIQFASSLPREIGLLTHLKSFEIIDASLQGSLPSQLGLLTQLTHLHVGMNQLSSNLPSEIWQLTSLQRLVLSQNQFLSGTLPSSESSSMAQLQTLHWQATQLSGTIPTQIGQWTKLSSVHLDQNQLTGTLPTQLGQLPLTSFLVKQNRLHGSLPTQLGAASPTMLEHLDVSWNQFDGSLPPQLFSNPLSTFSCYENNLTGTLPTQMGQLQEIREISLGENQFTGTIPNEIWLLFSSNSVLLDLESNSFLGTIPSSMCSNSKLSFDCAPPPLLCGCSCAFCNNTDDTIDPTP